MSLVRTVGLVGKLVNIYLQLVASCLDYFSCIFLNTTKKRYDVPSHLGLNVKNLISALLPSCTFIITSFPAAWILRSQSFQTHRKCQLFYLSAVSLRVHTSSEPLSASIRFSRSAVRLLLSLLSETDVGAHRIMVDKTNGGFTSRMLHLRDFLLYFFCSYSTFNAAVCWKKKTYTKERGTEKKFLCIYITSRFRRGGGGGGGGRQWAPWVSDIWAWRTCAQEPFEGDYGGKIGLLHQRDVKCNVLLW